MASGKPSSQTDRPAPPTRIDPDWVTGAVRDRPMRVAPAPPRTKGVARSPKALAAARQATKAFRGRRRGMSLLNQFLLTGVCLSFLAFSLPTALMLMLALMPTFCALVVAPSQGYYSALSIGALNVAGTWPFLLKLWTTGHNIANAMTIIINPYAWLVIYGAAAVGWMLCQWFPIFVSSFMSIFSARRLKEIERTQKKLIEEWGPEVERP